MKKERINLNAALILDKPIGMSSNQALQKAKRLMNAKKAGHTGSLDVLATGLLPICFGEATKFSQFLLDADKRYLTTACLGKKTTTADAEGEVLAEKPVPDFSQDQLQAVLKDFLGKIFCRRMITHMIHKKGDESRLPECNELLKRLSIPITHTEH